MSPSCGAAARRCRPAASGRPPNLPHGSTTPGPSTPSRRCRPWSAPRFNRGGMQVKSPYNAAAIAVHGIEPQYQAIRTLDIERGRVFSWSDEERCAGRDRRRRRLAQLFGAPRGARGDLHLNGFPFTVDRQIRKKDQDRATAAATTTRCSCRLRRWPATFRAPARRLRVSQIIVAPHPGSSRPARRARRPHRPHRRHRLAARAGGPPDARRPPRFDPARSRRHACGTPRSRR